MQRRHVVWVSARGHPATRTVPTAIVVVVVAVVTPVVGRGCRRSRGQSERRRRRCGVVHQVLLHVRLNVGGGTGTAVRRTQRPRRRRRLPHTHTQQSQRSVSSFATLAITSRSVSDSSDTSWRCSSSCFFCSCSRLRLHRFLGLFADTSELTCFSVPSLPALGPWATPDELGPSL